MAIDNGATIVVTGAAGFIGSCLVEFLNEKGFDNLILVDDFSRADKKPNLNNKKFLAKVEREEFFDWLHAQHPSIGFFFYFGFANDHPGINFFLHQPLNF